MLFRLVFTPAETYLEILDEVFLPSITALGLNPAHVTIGQDNCPMHRARIIQQWFAEKGITQLEWPSYVARHEPN